MDYAQLSSCTLHLRRVDPERLANDEQIDRQKQRLAMLCKSLELDPVDINVKRSVKRKGQAFITFGNTADASKALGFLNGFQMVKGGRRVEAEVAITPADALVEKFCTPEVFEEHVKRRKAEKDRKATLIHTTTAPSQKRPGDPISKPAKMPKSSKASAIPDEYLPPNNVLFVRDVPEDYNEDMLTALFRRYPGFREVRTVPLPAYKGTAFVEYEANEGAIQAREALNGRTIGDGVLRVTYQKAG